MRTGIKPMGLQVDISSFQVQDSVTLRDYHIRMGGHPKLLFKQVLGD